MEEKQVLEEQQVSKEFNSMSVRTLDGEDVSTEAVEKRNRWIKENIIPEIERAFQENSNDDALIQYYLAPLAAQPLFSPVLISLLRPLEAFIQGLLKENEFFLATDEIFSREILSVFLIPDQPRRILSFEPKFVRLNPELIKAISDIVNFHYFITHYSEGSAKPKLASMLNQSLFQLFHGDISHDLWQSRQQLETVQSPHIRQKQMIAKLSNLGYFTSPEKLTGVKTYYLNKLPIDDNNAEALHQILTLNLEIQYYSFLIDFYTMLQRRRLKNESIGKNELQYFSLLLGLFEEKSRNITSRHHLCAGILEGSLLTISVLLSFALAITAFAISGIAMLMLASLILPAVAPILANLSVAIILIISLAISAVVLIGIPYATMRVIGGLGRYCFFPPVPEAIKALDDEMRESLRAISEQPAGTSLSSSSEETVLSN